jgi:hypothetical protein
MANTKISALPAATTPLAGTEVLPIVQSSVTVKVANNDLRPKQIQSNATSGVLQIVGPAVAATRVMTTPDANFTVARTDAAQSFTGNQTLSTGNLIIGTSGAGVDFSATPGTGTSELLDDYEEGSYTATMSPTSSGSITLAGTHNTLQYTIIGRQVTIIGMLMVNSVSSPVGAININLPFAAASGNSSNSAALLFVNGSNGPQAADFIGFVGAGTSTLQIYLGDGNFVQSDSADAMQANTQMTISATYFV